LTNIKGDRGGKTNFGIIEKTFLEPEYKPLRDKFGIHRIEDVTKEFAYAFYKFGWWDRLRLEEVRAINPLIAERLLDIGVNGGRGTGVMYLQRIINLFNDNQKLYPDIAVDGGMGPGTIGALRKLVEVRKNDPNVFKNIVLQMYILQG
ncbi:hypothetical protein GF531_13905, partial [Staphylococcus aureus]|uniref:glycosyl hydrolase 108 family protein n=1 Tax=Staphylococcus aureus TaxID=1280 RepID=UPI001326A537